MSTSLNALLTQLNWQKNEIALQINIIDKECNQLAQHIEHLDNKLNEVCPRSKIINPELEISRLNFMLQQQEEKRIIAERLKQQEIQKDQLHHKMQRIKTELKMLELYLTRKQQQLQHEQTKAEEFALDEWVLQKRESA